MSAPRVVVVGGGPAGLATAIALRRHGVEPLVLERRQPPIDKACGEGIMPDGVAALRRLGAVPPGMPFRGIRYCDEESVADAPFPGPPGLGVRRTALHAALAAAAAAAGVAVRWDTRVEAVTAAGEVRLASPVTSPETVVLQADWVVAADGLRSPLRAMLGLAAAPAGRPRFGVRRHYRLAPWTDRVEVHWRTGVEAYVTPVAADEVGVAMLWGGGGDFDALLGRFPELATHLAGAERTSRDRGAGPFRQRTRGVVRGRVALVGDAAGYLDALTGEGLGLAFQQAEALAAAIAAGDLGPYAATCRRLARLADGFTHLLLFCERRPRLRRRLVRELGRRPELFGRLLGAHARQIPARAVGARAVAHLLLGLLRG
jgi:flavin-dependent dehydrogenase